MMRLAADPRPGHGAFAAQRLGRRRFLVDLGRGTFAVAILGGLTACSDSGSSTATGDSPRPTGTAPTTPPGTSTASAPSSPAASAGAAAPATTVATDQPLRWAQTSLGFVSAYVLVRGNEAAVVDTGTEGSVDAIGSTLATLGVTFDDVGHVILTHHHPDHVGSLPGVLGAASGAHAYAGTADVANITGVDGLTAVDDGDDVFGLQVIATPGHTPGSIAVLDTGIGLLVVGDALNGDDGGTAVLGPNAGFTDDMTTATGSVRRLATFEASIDAIAFGHGQPVTSGAGELLAELASSL